MSFEAVERQLRELDALKHYDRVKEEREELAQRCAGLETRVSKLAEEIDELQSQLKDELAERTGLEERLKTRDGEFQRLNRERDEALGELTSLQDLKAGFIDGRELTLERAKHEFIKAQEAEIGRRASEKFGELKADDEAKMPRLVHQKLLELIEKGPLPAEIGSTIKAKADEIADEKLREREGWPDWFRELYAREVEAGIRAGLDAEFERKVGEESAARAKEELRQLKEAEWPRWCAANVKPGILRLTKRMRQEALRALNGPWRGYRCDRCGTLQREFEARPSEVESLLTQGYFELECSNPECLDGLLLRSWKHRIRVSLHGLIEAHAVPNKVESPNPH